MKIVERAIGFSCQVQIILFKIWRRKVPWHTVVCVMTMFQFSQHFLREFSRRRSQLSDVAVLLLRRSPLMLTTGNGVNVSIACSLGIVRRAVLPPR